MKPWSLLPGGVALCILLWIGCGPNPTEPTRYEKLKSDYIALAGTLKHEVELFRGKTFKRPVKLAIYTLEQYKSAIIQSSRSSSPAEKATSNSILRAEGLLHPTADYFAGQDSMLANETGGFYKEGTDSVYVILDDNASYLTDFDSMALFHEMVHALQDQEISLITLSGSAHTSDRSYGLQYAIEGEAELFSFYYLHKIWFGVYPSTSQWVMDQFDAMAVIINNDLDSIHRSKEPLVLKQPFYWAYYSYGPRFVNSVAGRDWQLIDANIYSKLPIKTRAALHPETFPQEYSLDFNRVYDFLDSTQVAYGDVDELGEVLMNVLFREWDFPDYLQLSEGLLADNMVAYRTQMSDSVRTAWYTYWQDPAKSAVFFTKIASLINMKRNITLPAAAQRGDTSVVNDSVNKVYIETNGGHVFVLENYQRNQLDELITRMRGVKWYVDGALAKSAVSSRRFPFIDKSKLARGWWRQRDRTHSPDGSESKAVE